MKLKNLFGTELIKKLDKTHKAHADFTNSNREMKIVFKKNFNKNTLAVISDVVNDLGFDDDKGQLKDFLDKVKSGNFDDSDVEIFKIIIEPYKDSIVKKLEQSGNFDIGEITKE